MHDLPRPQVGEPARVEHGLREDVVPGALQHRAVPGEQLRGRPPPRQAGQGGAAQVLEVPGGGVPQPELDLGGARVERPVDPGDQVGPQAKEQEGAERRQDGREQHDVPDRQPDADRQARWPDRHG